MFKKTITSLTIFAILFSCNTSFAQNIPMTFHNGSFFSIYLSIPGVMNPNLFPKSNSVVSLDAGQVVYFFPNGKNGKKEILFSNLPIEEQYWRRIEPPSGLTPENEDMYYEFIMNTVSAAADAFKAQVIQARGYPKTRCLLFDPGADKIIVS